jgi:hypothetical protein
LCALGPSGEHFYVRSFLNWDLPAHRYYGYVGFRNSREREELDIFNPFPNAFNLLLKCVFSIKVNFVVEKPAAV